MLNISSISVGRVCPKSSICIVFVLADCSAEGFSVGVVKLGDYSIASVSVGFASLLHTL